MNIVMITTDDPAGTALGFARALNEHTPYRCRVVTTEDRPAYKKEKDLHVPWLKDFDELHQVLSEANIFHFHMTADEDLPLGPLRVRDFLRGRRIVHHHHGEPPFRANPRAFADRELAQGRRAIVSTPDLAKMYPEATWIPNPVPLDDPDYRPRGEYNHRYEIFAGQSPTRKDLKNTAEFRDVMERLTPRNPRLRARIIENTPHRDCLRLKKSCDIFFDHMQGYYGVSSLEALSQGVPVIAGLDDWNLEKIKETTGAPDVPWVIARNRDQLRQRLTGLIEDRAARRETGLKARAWMEKHWTEKRWAEMLVRFYEAA